MQSTFSKFLKIFKEIYIINIVVWRALGNIFKGWLPLAFHEPGKHNPLLTPTLCD